MEVVFSCSACQGRAWRCWVESRDDRVRMEVGSTAPAGTGSAAVEEEGEEFEIAVDVIVVVGN